jgi:phage gpG-like protein
MIRVSIRRDSLTPDLRRRLRAVKNKAPLLKAVADVLSQTAKGAFNDPQLRPTSWPAKKDGSPATLRRDQLLARSPRTVSTTPKRAILGSDRRYAAVHQFGSRPGGRGIPARRYMPFIDRRPTPLAVRRGSEALRIALARASRS